MENRQPPPSGELTYAFEQVNRARVITLRGVDNEGRSIPAQTIEITPTEDVPSAGFTPVPYYFQYDNLYDPSATCGLTSAAMMIGARGASRTPDALFLDYGRAQGQSPESLAQLYEWEGYTAEHGRAGTRTMLKSLLDGGDPVVVHGFWTDAGHIAILTGYDATGWIANDPAGDWEVGYGTTSGEGVHYGFDGGWDLGLRGRRRHLVVHRTLGSHQTSREAMVSAARVASPMMVICGFTPSAVGTTPPSTT